MWTAPPGWSQTHPLAMRGSDCISGPEPPVPRRPLILPAGLGQRLERVAHAVRRVGGAGHHSPPGPGLYHYQESSNATNQE